MTFTFLFEPALQQQQQQQQQLILLTPTMPYTILAMNKSL
jgi:hypothetical protein